MMPTPGATLRVGGWCVRGAKRRRPQMARPTKSARFPVSEKPSALDIFSTKAAAAAGPPMNYQVVATRRGRVRTVRQVPVMIAHFPSPDIAGTSARASRIASR